MALWDEVKSNLVEWYSVTSDKTVEAARIGSRRWDKFGISRDIERQFSELGSLIYVSMKEDDSAVLESEAVLEVIKRIEILEEELTTKGEEIDGIRAEYARAASAGGQDHVVTPDTEATEPITETVITDPVLEVGAEESAILVEPVVDVEASPLPVDEEDELKETRE